MAEMRNGFVIRRKGADYDIVSDGEEIRCALGGRLRLGENPEEVLPVVGDDVEFRLHRETDSRVRTGLITAIHPRRTVFARSSSGGRKRYRIFGANLDRVFLVFAAAEPALNTRLVDRMLVAAERGGMEPLLCVNKMDLAEDERVVRGSSEPYEVLGYRVILCSARTGRGMEELRGEMTGRKSIMVGPSGSGKTTIASVIQPGLELKVGAVSEKTGKGRHTTSHFELHPLAGGGYLGDTPGMREFGIWGITREGLADYFREFESYRGRCRYPTCTHSHEPGCAVKEAVREGAIRPERLESYQRILETLS